MSFASGNPKPANRGRKKGARNKRTLAAAPKAYPDALEHLAKAMASDDGTVNIPSLHPFAPRLSSGRLITPRPRRPKRQGDGLRGMMGAGWPSL
jgi:hypothetical protein